MSVAGGTVVAAVTCGDLKVTRGHTPPDVLFGLWSLVYGGLLIEATSPSLSDLGIRDSRAAIRRNCNAMLDGIGWKPAFDASSYNRWVRQIYPKLVVQAKAIVEKTVFKS